MRQLKMTLHSTHIMVGSIRIAFHATDAFKSFNSLRSVIDGLQSLLFQLVGEQEIIEGDTVRLDECHWLGMHIPQITLVVHNGEADFSVQADESMKRRLNAAQTQDTIDLALTVKSDAQAIRCRMSITSVVQWSFGTGKEFVGYFSGLVSWSIKESAALWYAMQIQRN